MPDSELRDDVDAVSDKLRMASTWGDAKLVAHMLQTCYVGQGAAASALVEAAKSGSEDVARILLDAGALPFKQLVEHSGKTPLHVACEAGNVGVALACLEKITSKPMALRRCNQGYTAIELARMLDYGFLANKLEQAIAVKWGS